MSTDEKLARLLQVFEDCRAIHDEVFFPCQGASVQIFMRPGRFDLRTTGIQHQNGETPGFQADSLGRVLDGAIESLESHRERFRVLIQAELEKSEKKADGLRALLGRRGAS